MSENFLTKALFLTTAFTLILIPVAFTYKTLESSSWRYSESHDYDDLFYSTIGRGVVLLGCAVEEVLVVQGAAFLGE